MLLELSLWRTLPVDRSAKVGCIIAVIHKMAMAVVVVGVVGFGQEMVNAKGDGRLTIFCFTTDTNSAAKVLCCCD